MRNVRHHDREVDMMVQKDTMKHLIKLAIMGVNKTKEIITEKGLIKDGYMRAEMTHEAHERELFVRYGNNRHYTIYQELGTSRGIRPGNFLRGSLEWLRTQ